MACCANEGIFHFNSLTDWSKKGNNSAGSDITFSTASGAGGRGGFTIGLNSNLRKVLPAAKTTVFQHNHFYIPVRTRTQIMGFRSATNDNIILEAMEDGSIRVLLSSSLFGSTAFNTTGATQIGITDPAIWDAATHTHIQVKVTISATVGEVTIKINGDEVLSLINTNTYSGAGSTSTTQIGWGGNFGISTATYSDIFTCDTSGTVNNTFQGVVAVYEDVSPVDGDELQWTRSTGAGTWSSHVDQNPQTGDAIYLRSTANGDRNCFSFPAISGTVGSVLALKETVCLRKEDASYGAVKLYSRSTDAIDHDGAQQTVTEDYIFRERIFDQDPKDDTNWTVAKANNTQLGFVNVS